MPNTVDRFFKLTERGTTVKAEVLGGTTTFLTMAYIMVVNPAILSFAGIPAGPSTVATILTAIFGCTLMGLYANLPLAVAPYMGENAFIAFGLTSLGISWQQRLGAVFIAGIAFLVLTILPLRAWLANSISTSLKHSFGVGIGLFLAFIGLYQTGIVTSAASGLPPAALLDPRTNLLRAPAVPLKIGNLHEPRVLLSCLCFLIISVLLYRKTRGGILLGMIITAVLGYLLGLGEMPMGLTDLPFQGPYVLTPIALKLDIPGILKLSYLPILLTLCLMSFLDTLGTLVGVGSAGNLLDEKGNFPRIERPMLVDALSCTVGSLLGSSTSGAFIESASGIREGARTGLAALTAALLFAASLFFLPLLMPLQHLTYAYAPALMAVGLLMLTGIKKVDLDDLTEAVPAFATIALMLFTYNIANGLTAGLILHPLFKALTGRFKEINAGSIVLAAVCLIYYIFGLPH